MKFPADHGRLRRRLDELDAVHEATVEQRDTYYDAPHRSFAETDEALRIRRVRRDGTTDARIAYKGPLVDEASKTREEVETGVEDGETMAAVLDRLGFSAVATVEKRRAVYALDGYAVVLDAVEGLGEFVEVERESADVAATREGAFDLCRELGLDPDDQIRASYLELLLGE